MPSTSGPLHPPVLWAQRDAVVFVTMDVEDLKVTELTVTPTQLHCKGIGGHARSEYECTIEFHGEVDSENYRRIPGDRRFELVLPKKLTDGKGGWWPRLVKGNARMPWIKVDFNKWIDEDEAEGEKEDVQFDLNNMMEKLGGGSGAPPDLGDFDDSDNEDLPDLEDDVPEEDAETQEKGMDLKPKDTAEVGAAEQTQ